MKLGVAGYLPSDWRLIDAAAAERVRKAGFKGASLFIDRPLEADPAEIRRVKAAYGAAGLEVAQANGWYESLVDPDDGVRQAGVRGVQALVRLGRNVNAATVFVRPGGLNPAGHWYAHRDNHTVATFARLVDSLRQAAAAAETEAMTLAIEAHVLSPLDSVQRVRDLLDGVASPALKFNLDPVNFIGTVADVYDSARVLRQIFDKLGGDVAVAHAKDVALAEEHVVHINEVVIGTGTLDYELFLAEFERVCPQGYMLIEHLPDDKVLVARRALLAVAARLGIAVEGA